MTTLDMLPQEAPDPIHQLLIADSKLGKSTYAAQAAKDGFTLLYIDSDNGLSALRKHLAGDKAAMSRVYYIRTSHPAAFLEELINSQKVMRWNLTADTMFSSMMAKPADSFIEIDAQKLQAARDVILVIDSWTSTASDAMGIGAEKAGVALTDMSNEMQKVYGNAFHRLTYILQVLQKAPFHVLVLAHGAYYERYEKSPGKALREIKQGDMILKETIRVPISSSRPHGVEMVKYFNHTAWLTMDRVGRVQIDYTRAYDRVGGGPPNIICPLDEFPFKKLLPLTVIPAGMPEGTVKEALAETIQKGGRLAAAPANEVKVMPAPSASNLAVNLAKLATK